jgi:hypothetical protein
MILVSGPMPRFQLLIANAFVVSVVTSFLTFYLTRTQEGEIHLPTAAEADERNVFDVTRPEDVTVGYPMLNGFIVRRHRS